ncbi:MAG: iron complex outermembrane recepter protein [Comamonadaceae bacterium]|nr:MAG: iron complex outermembrane recepter protein [Comamonadaceae bacterium]
MQSTTYPALALLVTLIFQSPLAMAQIAEDEKELAQAYGDRDFVSIATGTKQLLRKAPAAATVITAADIVAMGATTLSEVLETVPGMHISRNALQNNYTPTYGIRGILTDSSPHVLMMINGIPMTNAFLGNPNEQRGELPVENISRIEVIRGPGSAVYGADAFAGTVNIVTKTAEEVNGSLLGVRLGSFNSRDTWFQHGSQQGELEVAGYLKIGRTDGQRGIIRADAQSKIDALGLAPAASLAPGALRLGKDTVDAQIDLAYQKFRIHGSYALLNNAGTSAGIAAALDPTGLIRSERFSGDLSWNDPNFGSDLSLTLQAAHMQLANENITPLTLFPKGAFFGSFPDGMMGAPEKWERQTRLSAAMVYSGLSDHRLRLGMGHDQIEIYKTAETKNFIATSGLPISVPMYTATGINLFLSPHSRNVNYAYLQDEWGFARDWTLTGGVRYDHYSDFGSTTNPRLALVWEARQDITVKLMYGRAFRAPSFTELYVTGNPVALGNPALKPEKIATFEGLVSWQMQPNLHTSLSIFQHHIADIIALSGTTYMNTGRQNGSGGEIEFTWDPMANLRLSGYYAYQKNVDPATGQNVGYAPQQHLYTRADWRFSPGWFVSAQLNRIAQRKRPIGDTRPDVPDYTSVDLTLRTDQPKNGWDFAISLRNALNADIREPSKASSGIIDDFPMPGRTLYLQASYRL